MEIGGEIGVMLHCLKVEEACWNGQGGSASDELKGTYLRSAPAQSMLYVGGTHPEYTLQSSVTHAPPFPARTYPKENPT